MNCKHPTSTTKKNRSTKISGVVPWTDLIGSIRNSGSVGERLHETSWVSHVSSRAAIVLCGLFLFCRPFKFEIQMERSESTLLKTKPQANWERAQCGIFLFLNSKVGSPSPNQVLWKSFSARYGSHKSKLINKISATFTFWLNLRLIQWFTYKNCWWLKQMERAWQILTRDRGRMLFWLARRGQRWKMLNSQQLQRYHNSWHWRQTLWNAHMGPMMLS